MRVAVAVLGRQADDASSSPTRRRARARAPARGRASGSPTIAPTVHARVERRVRVLEDDLHVAAQRAHVAPRRASVMSCPSKRTSPPWARAGERQARPTVDLPAARLADEPERLAARDRRSETPSTAWTTCRLRRSTPRREREVLDEVARPRAAARVTPRPPAERPSRDSPWRRRQVEHASRAPAATREAAARPRGSARPRSGQRGWNGQPAGRAIRLGGDAGDRRAAAAAPRVEPGQRAAAGPACTGAAGRRRLVRRRRLDDPARVHHGDARRPTSATTPRSWVIEHDRHAVLVAASSASSVEDLRLDGDVEGRRRLVRDQDSGSHDERHRDHHALAHAARELVRVARRGARAGPGCRPRQRLERRARSAPRSEMSSCAWIASPICVADAVERVERKRVLEDHRHALAADPARGRRPGAASRSPRRRGTRPSTVASGSRVRPMPSARSRSCPTRTRRRSRASGPGRAEQRNAVDGLDDAVPGGRGGHAGPRSRAGPPQYLTLGSRNTYRTSTTMFAA